MTTTDHAIPQALDLVNPDLIIQDALDRYRTHAIHVEVTDHDDNVLLVRGDVDQVVAALADRNLVEHPSGADDVRAWRGHVPQAGLLRSSDVFAEHRVVRVADLARRAALAAADPLSVTQSPMAARLGVPCRGALIIGEYEMRLTALGPVDGDSWSAIATVAEAHGGQPHHVDERGSWWSWTDHRLVVRLTAEVHSLPHHVCVVEANSIRMHPADDTVARSDIAAQFRGLDLTDQMETFLALADECTPCAEQLVAGMR